MRQAPAGQMPSLRVCSCRDGAVQLAVAALFLKVVRSRAGVAKENGGQLRSCPPFVYDVT